MRAEYRGWGLGIRGSRFDASNYTKWLVSDTKEQDQGAYNRINRISREWRAGAADLAARAHSAAVAGPRKTRPARPGGRDT